MALGRPADLFADSPALRWLPDETLFSLVSRLHALWGASDAGRTALALFGGRRAGIQHDFPGYLREFERRTAGHLGSAAEIARSKTSLAFYRRFIRESLEQKIVHEMCLGDVRHLKYRLGILTSRFRAHHPLKACPTCMAEDLERHGWAYWHVAHQHPGVWVCLSHQGLLRESVLKSTGVQRFGWSLPRLEELRGVVGEEKIWGTSGLSGVKRFAQLIQSLVSDVSAGRIDLMRLYPLYQSRLNERGLMRGGRFRWSDISQEFLAHAIDLRGLPELRAFGAAPQDVERQLGRLLRPPRSGMHPLWHLVLIDWLFDGCQDFAQSWKNLASLETRGVIAAPAEEIQSPIDSRRARLLELVVDQSASIRAAATEVGVDTSTAMAWAAGAGIEIRRRSKVLTPERRVLLESQLRGGVEKAHAADAAGVSIATVTRTLFTTPGLHESWRQARERRARLHHRRVWQKLIARHKGVGTKMLRGMEPASYAWLYRNDRDWLRGQTPEREVTARRGLSASVWRERDMRLHQALHEAAIHLAQDAGCKRIYLWMLYQAVPDLRPMLGRLDRLPLTMRCIEQTLAWRGPATLTAALPFM